MGLDELYDRLEEMVMVCHSFPSPLRKQKLSFWPEYANDANLAYGYNQTTVSIKPTNQMIDRCDEALLWVLDMPEEDRKIIWLRGSKLSWRKISTFFSCNKDTAKAKHTLALVRLQHQLRQK